MKALFWNVRGFAARGRRDQIHDLVCGDHIDILGLVETFKESFSPSELSAVARMIDLTGIIFLPRVTLGAS